MVVVSKIVMIEVDLNEIEGAGVIDVVVVATEDLLEGGVEVVVVAVGEVVVGVVDAAAIPDLSLIKKSS